MITMQMFILILIALVGNVAVQTNEPAIRSYFVEKDFFIGIKMGEFSIFDSRKSRLLYRIESCYTIGGKLEITDQSSKQVIGRLTNSLNLLLYKGNLSIFNSSSNQWIDGKIENLFHMLNEKYLIKWNNQSILMENKFGSLTTTFQFQNHTEILVRIEKRKISYIWSNKYDIQIFSRQLPNTIYFLALAVKDNNNRARGKG